MEQHVGICVGGVHDKQHLTHWAKIKKFYRPMVAAFSMSPDTPIEVVEIGEYRLNDFGQWHWHATDAGMSFKKLFGPPK